MSNKERLQTKLREYEEAHNEFAAAYIKHILAAKEEEQWMDFVAKKIAETKLKIEQLP